MWRRRKGKSGKQRQWGGGGGGGGRLLLEGELVGEFGESEFGTFGFTLIFLFSHF